MLVIETLMYNYKAVWRKDAICIFAYEVTAKTSRELRSIHYTQGML